MGLDTVALAIALANSSASGSYSDLTNKPQINGITIDGNKTIGEYGGLSTADIGRGVSLGFNATLQNNVLTFTNPLETPYEIKTNYEYEIDLHFPAVGSLDDSVEMVIMNDSETIEFIAPTHADSNTHATVGDLKQLMYYNQNIGFRWLFNARCKVTSSNKRVLLIYPVVVNMANIPDEIVLPITNQEMMDAETETTPMYRGRQIKIGNIFICNDNNGYKIGHCYKWTGVSGAEWEDCTEPTANDISEILGYIPVKNVHLKTDENTIWLFNDETQTPLTYAQIKALIEDEKNSIYLTNGHYSFYGKYYYDPTISGQEIDAIGFVGSTQIDGKVYSYRVVINANNDIIGTEIQLAAQNLGISGATVGQYLKVKTVDSQGRPVTWEAVDHEVPEASSTVSGIMKLYDTDGEHTDGAITQRLFCDEMSKKIEVSVNSSDEEIIFTRNL